MVPKGSSDAERFIELFRKYTQVKNDLKEFGRIQDLDNLPVIKALTMKLPGQGLKAKYSEFRVTGLRDDPTKSEYTILDEFMSHKKAVQQGILKLQPMNSSSSTSDIKSSKEKCSNCGRFGHKTTECRRTSSSIGRVNAISSQPIKPCPACNGQHTFKGKNGETLYKSGLASCDQGMRKWVSRVESHCTSSNTQRTEGTFFSHN